mgnify:CR=1 FL=1
MRLIHPLIVLRVLSNILFIETFTFLACLPVAIIYKESTGPFLFSSLITLSVASALLYITRKANTNDISNRDSFITVTSAWLLFSLCGVLPYILSGTIPSFVNAFFESSSGFTTTGASILQNVEILPFSILFWRSLTPWI